METNGRNNTFLTIAAVNSPPYSTIYEDPNGVISMKGPFGKLQVELFKRLNLSYVIKLPKDEGLGTMLPNGTATGMTGMLYNKEADLIFSPYGLSYGRFQAADYLPVILDATQDILSTSGESKKTVDFTNTIMRVSWMIWVGYLASIGSICLFYLFDNIVMSYKKERRERAIVNYATLSCYILEFMRIFVNQGSSQFATSYLKRILFLSFAITTFFFNMYFGGDLHTEAMVDTENNIDSLRELIDKSALCPLTPDGTLVHIFLRTGKGGIYDDFRERINSCPMSSIPVRELNSESTFRRIVSRKFALLTGRSSLLALGEQFCNMHPNVKLHMSREPVTIVLGSIAVGKHMDLDIKESITKMFERFINSGIMLKWMDGRNRPPCSVPPTFSD